MSSNFPLIIGLLNGYSSQMSGGDKHFIKLINYMVETDAISVCLPRNVYPKDFKKQVARLVYFNPGWIEFVYKSNFLLFFLYIYRIIVSAWKLNWQKFDTLIISSHLFFDIWPILFVPKKGRTFIVTIHHLIGEQNRQGIHRMTTTLLEKISLHVIKYKQMECFVVSPVVAEKLINKYKFNPEKIHRTNNGLDLGSINKIKPNIEKFDLVYCGRLHHRKGIYGLLKIVKELRSDFPKISMAIIGDGPEKYDLRAEIARQGLKKHIKLFGYASDQIKYSVIKSSQVFLLPSYEEGWGIVVAESLACRTPVVVSSLPEIKRIWKHHVLWANQINPTSFVKFTKTLLKNKSKRVKLATKGYEYVQQFSWKKILTKEYNTITKLTNRDKLLKKRLLT